MLNPSITSASLMRIQGTGEMADRIRAFPWKTHILGPIESWPPELTSIVNMMLSTDVMAAVYWGPEMILFYNDTYVPHLTTKHPALGEPLWTVWGEARSQVEELFTSPYRTGKTFVTPPMPLELVFDGQLKKTFYSMTGSPVMVFEDGRSEIGGLYLTITDETSNVLRTEQLADTEARAGRVLDSIGDAVIVTDAKSQIITMNGVAEQLTRWTEAEARGRKFAEVFRIVNEQTRKTVPSPVSRVLETGRVVELANHTILIAKDGYETHIDDSAAPIRNDAGELTGIVLVFRDIQERREAERKRERLAAQLTQIQEATTDSILSIDRNWTVTYLNDAAKAATGPLSETVGKNFWEEYPDTIYDNSPFVENYERAMNEGIDGDFEAYYPDPLDIWVRVRVRPTPDGIVLFFQNVTNAKRAEAVLIQTEKLTAVGRLAASIAHEINNPLEAVTNLLYLIQGTEDIAEIRSYVDTAERELRRVSLIANQTLRFHKQSTKPVAAFCYDLIGDSLAIFQSRLLNNKIIVEKRKRAEHPVDCLNGEIRQVLNNLIGNALDAMPLGGRLILRSREQMNYRTGKRGLVITVADTGSGMSATVQKKVFEAFYTTKGIGGTGLGLWVSHGIVERHQGTLRLRSSQRDGQSGTVFTLFLPF